MYYYYLITDYYAARTCDLTDVQFRALLKVYNELQNEYDDFHRNAPEELRVIFYFDYRTNWKQNKIDIDLKHGIPPFPVKQIKIVPCSILADASLDFIERKASYKKWKACNGKITQGTNAPLFSCQGDIEFLEYLLDIAERIRDNDQEAMQCIQTNYVTPVVKQQNPNLLSCINGINQLHDVQLTQNVGGVFQGNYVPLISNVHSCGITIEDDLNSSNSNSHITSSSTSTVIHSDCLPISIILESETDSSNLPVSNPATLDEDKQVTEPMEELIEDTKNRGNKNRNKRICELSQDHNLSWGDIAHIVGAEFNEELNDKAVAKAAGRYAKDHGLELQSREPGRKLKKRTAEKTA